MPLISICIPSYKRISYLQRLLNSIAIQTFRDFEVIVSDDSNDNSVKDLLIDFEPKFKIRYFKNDPPLGTPANWNFAMAKAEGEWIKLMHDDDWFATKDALQVFYNYTQQNTNADFFYSAFQNIKENPVQKEIVRMFLIDKLLLKLSPYHLLKKVYIGNPSCTLVRKSLNIWYDVRFKFIVDFEYYIRVIQQTKTSVYIDKVLLNIGFHEDQVTAYTKYDPAIQIPENVIFLNEQKKDILKNIIVFDYFWRLNRNLKINSSQKLLSLLGTNKPKPGILLMISFQKRVPFFLLKKGLLSKLLMLMTYCIYRIRKLRIS